MQWIPWRRKQPDLPTRRAALSCRSASSAALGATRAIVEFWARRWGLWRLLWPLWWSGPWGCSCTVSVTWRGAASWRTRRPWCTLASRPASLCKQLQQFLQEFSVARVSFIPREGSVTYEMFTGCTEQDFGIILVVWSIWGIRFKRALILVWALSVLSWIWCGDVTIGVPLNSLITHV